MEKYVEEMLGCNHCGHIMVALHNWCATQVRKGNYFGVPEDVGAPRYFSKTTARYHFAHMRCQAEHWIDYQSAAQEEIEKVTKANKLRLARGHCCTQCMGAHRAGEGWIMCPC